MDDTKKEAAPEEVKEVRKNGAADLIMGALLIIFGIYVAYTALNMRVYTTFLSAPGFFPLILGVVFIILGAMMVASAIKRKGFAQVKVVFAKSNLISFVKHHEFIRVIILVGMMAIFIFGLIGRIHFGIATSIYLFANFMYLKSTSWWKAIIISVVAALMIVLAFTRFFNIPLP